MLRKLYNNDVSESLLNLKRTTKNYLYNLLIITQFLGIRPGSVKIDVNNDQKHIIKNTLNTILKIMNKLDFWTKNNYFFGKKKFFLPGSYTNQHI